MILLGRCGKIAPRRIIMIVRFLLVFGTAVCFASSLSAQEKRPPNIIHILADDKDYYFCKKHVANEKTWKTPSIFKNWRLAKFG
jgi:hypothetical protein